jgi:hypothetical protein
VASNVFLHEAEGESVDDERIESWMTRPGLRFTPIFDALYPLLMPMLIDLVGSAWPPPAAGLCRLEVSPASVRKLHRVLSMVLAYAIKDGRLRLPVNPAAGVSLPRVRHAEKRYFEPPTGCRACRGVPRTVPAPGALLGPTLAFALAKRAALRVRRLDFLRRRTLVAESVTPSKA